MIISVALCTYNGEAYIKEQMLSLFRQTRLPDEIIICDDRSSDGTVNIIMDIISKPVGGVKCSLYQNENRLGYIHNFEKATRQCSGEIIFWCDQDDVWDETKIEKMERVFLKHADCALCYCDARVTDKDLRIVSQSLNQSRIHEDNLLLDALENRTPYGCCIAVKKVVLQEWKEPLLAHDWFATLYAHVYGKAYGIDEALQFYRRHESAVTFQYNNTLKGTNPKRDLIASILHKKPEEWFKDILLLYPCYEYLNSCELWKEKTKAEYPEAYKEFSKRRRSIKNYMNVYESSGISAIKELFRAYSNGSYLIRGNIKTWIVDAFYVLGRFL